MKKRKVVIIEDEIDLLSIISDLCKDLDCETYEYRTYEDFIYNYEILKPDLIITDRNLPGLNGNELIKSIRITDKNVPIVMISGSLSERDNIEALTLGANDFITKPFSFEVFLIKVKRFLKLTNNITDAEIIFIPEQKIVKKGDVEISLTEIESRIFKILFNRNYNFASRNQLHNENKSRSLDVHINKLRKKISSLNLEIDTVRNKGYRLKQVG